MNKTIRIVSIVVIFIVALFVSSCRVCKPGAMRCNQGKAELCAKSGQWKLVSNCKKVKPEKPGWCCKCKDFNSKKKCYCSRTCRCEIPK